MSVFLNDPSPVRDELQQGFQRQSNSPQRWETLKNTINKYQVYSIEIYITNTTMQFLIKLSFFRLLI